MTRLMDLLERRRLGDKLALGFLIVGCVTLVIAAQAIYNQRVLRDSIERLYTEKLVGIADIEDAHVDLGRMSRGLRGMLLALDAEQRDTARKRMLEAEAGIQRRDRRCAGPSSDRGRDAASRVGEPDRGV